MADYATCSVHEIMWDLNPGNAEKCAELDPHIANKLDTVETLAEVFYYLCYGDAHLVLPETRAKINQLLERFLEETESVDWWRYEAYKLWLSDELKFKLAKVWVADPEAQDVWIVQSVPYDSEVAVQALGKLTDLYKRKRSHRNIKAIEKLFANISSEHLDAACALVSKSTPAIAVSLLSREDVNDKYTLKGLKALSKLSKQRSVGTKIDFQMLGHLGPKARLDAMKQLLGIMGSSKYSSKPEDGPFSSVPTRSDVETFLFPCSLKYNDQVVELMKEFDTLANNKNPI